MKEPPDLFNSAYQKLSNLAPLAKRLNEAYDGFTARWKTIEAELNALSCGVDVTAELPFCDLGEAAVVTEEKGIVADAGRDQLHLAYGRYRDEWRLLVRCRRVYRPGWDELESRWVLEWEKPLVDASREVRVAAGEHIAALIDLIELEARRKLESLDRVVGRK